MTGPTHEEKRQIFERFLPGKLSHDEIDTLLHFVRVESYPAGKEIYAKGSLGRSMMAVLRGRAKMASVSRAGKEIVFNIMHPGEIFGEIALLDGGQRSADAIAMTDCEILVLDRRDFMPLLEKREMTAWARAELRRMLRASLAAEVAAEPPAQISVVFITRAAGR